jgi:cytochrome c biogenesis protein CcmG, thiol:disulfide interchange protein DsbE
MAQRTKWIVAAVVLVLLAGVAVLSNPNIGTKLSGGVQKKDAQLVDQTTERPESGYRAPTFSLKGFDGKTVKLADLKGKPVVLNFWASWCGPCKEEMPDLQEEYNKYKDQVYFFAVNLTDQDNADDAKAFLQSHGVTIPPLLDPTGEVNQKYKIHNVPSTFAIDANGMMKEVRVGQLTKPAMDGMLERLIAK